MAKFFVVILLFLMACNTEENSWNCVSGDCNNGIGKRVWKDGGYENGSWKNGKLNGQASQFFGGTSKFSGDTYVGEVKDDLYEGKGTYIDVSEGSTYIGDWKNGKPDGFGKMTFAEDSKFPNQYYEGGWKDGKKSGHGTLFYGTVGKYKNDKYIGEWKIGERNGIGKYYFSSGSSYDGHWLNDNMHGSGMYTDKNGKGKVVYCENDDCESK